MLKRGKQLLRASSEACPGTVTLQLPGVRAAVCFAEERFDRKDTRSQALQAQM